MYLPLPMATQILILIDPQNDFTHVEGDYARRHAGITQITEAKLKSQRLVNSFGRNKTVIVRSDYEPGQFGQGLSICIPQTFGHEIDVDLRMEGTVAVVTKTEHSCFSSEAFTSLLQTNKIDTLILCGFLAEYCVKQTAMDALNAGYRVYLVEDCIATGDDVQHRKLQAFAALKDNGAIVIQSEELI